MSLPKFVTVWVCIDCGNYYASSSADNLTTKLNTDIKGDPTFARARCPTMECAMKGTMRIPMKIPLGEPQQVPPVSEISDIGLPQWSNERCGKCDKPLIVTGDVLFCSGCNSRKVAANG